MLNDEMILFCRKNQITTLNVAPTAFAKKLFNYIFLDIASMFFFILDRIETVCPSLQIIRKESEKKTEIKIFKKHRKKIDEEQCAHQKSKNT